MTLQLDAHGNLAVRIPRGALHGHTESTVGQEAARAVGAALRVAHRAYGHTTDAFRQALADRAVRGVSERGYVTVARNTGDRQPQVRVQRRTLRFLCEPELAEEIRSALADALTSFQQGHEHAYRLDSGEPEPGARPTPAPPAD